MNKYMNEAIKEAKKGIKNKDGGPFGAVIVKDGKIIARAHNQVVSKNDPTAHAEMQAIRNAAKEIENFDLNECEIYTTSEPCPMCYSAIHWARIGKIYYGCSREDAAKIGFDDKLIYDVLKGEKPHDKLVSEQIEREECLKPFKEWEDDEESTLY